MHTHTYTIHTIQIHMLIINTKNFFKWCLEVRTYAHNRVYEYAHSRFTCVRPKPKAAQLSIKQGEWLDLPKSRYKKPTRAAHAHSKHMTHMTSVTVVGGHRKQCTRFCIWYSGTPCNSSTLELSLENN